MEKFSNRFLANVILDLVDGVTNAEELGEKFGFNAKAAAQIWKTVEELKDSK